MRSLSEWVSKLRKTRGHAGGVYIPAPLCQVRFFRYLNPELKQDKGRTRVASEPAPGSWAPHYPPEFQFFSQYHSQKASKGKWTTRISQPQACFPRSETEPLEELALRRQRRAALGLLIATWRLFKLVKWCRSSCEQHCLLHCTMMGIIWPMPWTRRAYSHGEQISLHFPSIRLIN